jgi:hypothetical protein
MNTSLTFVTPKIAAQLLFNNEANRNLRNRVVDKYARDMLDGNWKTTHQGIAIYSDGNIADGQHRLSAIIQSGVSVHMLITTGMNKDASEGIDTNAPRSISDVIRLSGADSFVSSKDAVSATRALMVLATGVKSAHSPSVIRAYIEKNNNSIKLVSELFTKNTRGLSSAYMRAALIAAHMRGISTKNIERFVNILMSGIIEGDHENSAIRLREFLIFGSHGGQKDMYSIAKRTQRAIQLFDLGKPISKLFEPQELIYLPN